MIPWVSVVNYALNSACSVERDTPIHRPFASMSRLRGTPQVKSS